MTDSTRFIETTEVVRRLRAATRRIEAFFETQIERLNAAMQQLSEMQSEFEVARRLSADLDHQQKKWQRERDEEMIRLTKASESLARSWQELESRQRDLMISANAEAELEHVLPGSTAAVHSGQPESHLEPSMFEIQQLQRQVNEHIKRGR